MPIRDATNVTHCLKDEIEYLNTYQLISTKPVVYICNVDENSALSGNEFTKKIDTYAKETDSSEFFIEHIKFLTGQ